MIHKGTNKQERETNIQRVQLQIYYCYYFHTPTGGSKVQNYENCFQIDVLFESNS
jgi:hypothetical protein